MNAVFSSMHFLLQIAFAALLYGCQKPTAIERLTPQHPDTEELAIKSLANTARADNLYPDIHDEKCLTYTVEDHNEKAYEIAIQEKHVEGCGGDPQTSPIRDRFMVSGTGDITQVYDSVNGEYVAYQHKRP